MFLKHRAVKSLQYQVDNSGQKRAWARSLPMFVVQEEYKYSSKEDPYCGYTKNKSFLLLEHQSRQLEKTSPKAHEKQPRQVRETQQTDRLRGEGSIVCKQSLRNAKTKHHNVGTFYFVVHRMNFSKVPF